MARTVIGTVALVALVGCAASQGVSPAPPALYRIGPRESTFGGSPQSAGALNPKHALLYVADLADSKVGVFDLSVSGAPQVQEITSGVSSPDMINVDRGTGTLYVCNVGPSPNNITVYPFGATTPSLTMSDGVTRPTGVVSKADGTVYVAGSGSPAVIDVYPPGASKPSQVITDPLVQVPRQAVVDDAQNLYFADNATGVFEIPAGSSKPRSLDLSSLVNAEGLAFDEKIGRLYVSTVGNGNHYVIAYKLGSTAQLYHMHTVNADAITFGSKRFPYLFVPDFFGSDVQVYKASGRTPITALTTTNNPQGIAYKPPHVP